MTTQTNNPNGSTGPVTELGKTLSAKNAMKHGLSATSIERYAFAQFQLLRGPRPSLPRT